MTLAVGLWTEELNKPVQPYGVELWSGGSLNHRSSSSLFMSAYSGPGPVRMQSKPHGKHKIRELLLPQQSPLQLS
jgi:hypothetical protein